MWDNKQQQLMGGTLSPPSGSIKKDTGTEASGTEQESPVEIFTVALSSLAPISSSNSLFYTWGNFYVLPLFLLL